MKLKNNIYRDKKVVIYLSAGLVLIFFIVLTISLAFFSKNNNASGTITLGEIDFTLYEDNQIVGDVVPGYTASKTVSIINSRNVQGTNTRNLGALLFKFSIEIYINDEYDENLTQLITPNINLSSYTQSNGEYYYNGVLDKSQSVQLCTNINFSMQIDNTYQNEQFSIVFLVEAIQAQNDAYLELWQDAPSTWVNIIQNQLS